MNTAMAPAASGDFAGDRPGWRTWLLALAATLPLFVNLGLVQAWGSEHRWLDVAGTMLESGNWLEPRLEGRFYGDKPLLSYWAVAVAARAAGRLDEGVARLPSALAGAGAVLLTAWMAARLFGRRAAAPAAWILATSFSFLIWSRTAAADLLNLLLLTAAVAVYLEGVRRWRPWKVLLFFTLLALGGHAKGMPAVLIPLALAGLDTLLYRRARLRRQVPWILLGLLAGAALYLLPFLLSRLDRGDWALLGLMWKENFVRGFNAFDHRDSVWYYFYILPAMFLPWSLWLPGALAWTARQWRRASAWRFAGLAFALIFLFFTASESRRSYYILPAFPWAALLTAGFLADLARRETAGAPAGQAWRCLALAPAQILGGVLFLALTALAAGQWWPGAVGDTARALPGAGLLAAGLAAPLLLLAAGLLRRRHAWQIRAAFLAAGILALLYTLLAEPLRGAGLVERSFAREVRRRQPAATPVYYRGGNALLRYYLGPGPVAADAGAVQRLLAAGGEHWLVCEEEHLPELTPDLELTELLRGATPGFGALVPPQTRYVLFRCAPR